MSTLSTEGGRVRIHTSASVKGVHNLSEVVKAITLIVPRSELYYFWRDGKDNRSEQVDQIDPLLLARIYEAGTIGFGDKWERLVSGGISWFRSDGLPDTNKMTLFYQNAIDFHCGLECFTFSATESSPVKVIEQLASHFRANLGYISFAQSGDDIGYGYGNPLVYGLRDVYWLTRFGAPIVRQIGRAAFEHLVNMGICRDLGEDCFCLLLGSGPTDPDIPATKQMVREILGCQWFERGFWADYPKSGVLGLRQMGSLIMNLLRRRSADSSRSQIFQLAAPE